MADNKVYFTQSSYNCCHYLSCFYIIIVKAFQCFSLLTTNLLWIMTSYSLLKHIHLVTIALSLSGFLLRSYWRFFSPEKLNRRLVKILPHINDTLLLASAIGLTLILHQYPFVHHWLTAKVILLLVYIFAGAVSLRTRFSQSTSFAAFILAISSFSGIVFFAIRHTI